MLFVSKKVATSSSVHSHLVLFSSATGLISFASPQWNGRFKLSLHDFFFCFSVLMTLMPHSHGIRLMVDGKPDLKQGQQRTPLTATVGGKNLLSSATMEITTKCRVISKHNILTQVNINDTDTASPVQHTVMCVSFCHPAILPAPLLRFFPFHPADVLHLPEPT